MRPYLAPLTRSLAAPAGRLMPARSHGVRGPEPYVDDEGMNDRGNPYAFGAVGLPLYGSSPPGEYPRYSAIAGQAYGAPPEHHNADVQHSPHQPRLAIGTGYVTPPALWNLSGIAGGWFRQGAANPGRQPTAKLAFGRLGLLAGGHLGVHPPLPTLPEPQRMVQPQL